MEVTLMQKKEATFLTEQNIRFLKQMFKDESEYLEYMKTLWVLRDLTRGTIEIDTDKGLSVNTQHPNYRILKLTNELIGCLLREGYFFDRNGDAHTYGNHH
jgi:hypothetical protein